MSLGESGHRELLVHDALQAHTCPAACMLGKETISRSAPATVPAIVPGLCPAVLSLQTSPIMA